MLAWISPSAYHAVACCGCLVLLGAAGCDRGRDWSTQIKDPPEQIAAYQAPGASGVREGFRGERHPLLTSDRELAVGAHWESFDPGRGFSLGYFPLEYYSPFQQLRVHEPSRVYGSWHLSAFMPPDAELPSVGEIWSLDMPRVMEFLTQFHPAVSRHMNSTGRMPGPNGGFALLRAVSPTHYEIAFRVHAEIEPEPGLFYTPSHFAGRLLANKGGAVEEFHLAIPADETLNVTLTVALETEALLDIVKVERMELATSEVDAVRGPWSEEVDWPEARQRLKQLFYDFMEVAWVPPEEALDRARQDQRPIFAVVLWGGLDAQSC